MQPELYPRRKTLNQLHSLALISLQAESLKDERLSLQGPAQITAFIELQLLPVKIVQR